MALLTSILKTRNADAAVNVNENNLETGTIWAYTPGTEYGGFTCDPGDICWISPGTGTAVIEIWGAGGPGSRMCCCGHGFPGNAGAYSKKTISVTAGSYVCGKIGCPQMSDTGGVCFSGCSNATCICWCTASNGNGCMCAQGGAGGLSICTPGNSNTPFCCWMGNGRCGTVHPGFNPNCGTICGTCGGGWWIACGYGGDFNCCGTIGCTTFVGCYDRCIHCQAIHMPIPAGLFSNVGSTVTYWMDNADTQQSPWSGQAMSGAISALNALSRNPKRGNPMPHCYNSARTCGCYEASGCQPVLPVGVGGLPPTPCEDVRDGGIRGGWGGLRIKFF